MSRTDLNCGAEPTNITSVTGKHRHFDWDVDVDVVKVSELGANTPNDQKIDLPSRCAMRYFPVALSHCSLCFIRVL